MSYDRFSSWSNEIEPDQPEEPVSPSPEPVEPSSDLSAEDILSDLEALDSGESYEAEVGPRVFDEVYLQMKKTSPANRPSYKDGVLSFTK